MDFVAIDFEKLDDSRLSICEVGMVKYQNGELVNEFHSYIKPKESLNRNSFGKNALKHITDEMLQTAPTFPEVYNEMRDFVNGAILVCHNKGADLNYLYYNEKDYGLSGLYSEYIDTFDICKRGLEKAYETTFGKPIENHHHALDDARHTAEILLYLGNQLDATKFIKKDYIPGKEKPKSGNRNTKTVSSENLPKDDFLLSDYDFAGKTCVISGGSDEDKEAIMSELKKFGAKVTSDISGKTDALIVGENVGSRKEQKAMFQKAHRPGTFHIFTQEAVRCKLESTTSTENIPAYDSETKSKISATVGFTAFFVSCFGLCSHNGPTYDAYTNAQDKLSTEMILGTSWATGIILTIATWLSLTLYECHKRAKRDNSFTTFKLFNKEVFCANTIIGLIVLIVVPIAVVTIGFVLLGIAVFFIPLLKGKFK